VSSYAIADGARLLLFDPLAVPDGILALLAEREPADTAQDLIDKFGITAEQAGDGSPDITWLRDGDADVHWYGDGDRLPIGIDAYAGREHNDVALWVEPARAVVTGDSLADFGDGIAIHGQWLRKNVAREQVVEQLRPLLALPVEIVLPAHGAPTGRAALERALS